MGLTKEQRKFLKTIENKKARENQKTQFKLQNKFDKFLNKHPMKGFLFESNEVSDNDVLKFQLEQGEIKISDFLKINGFDYGDFENENNGKFEPNKLKENQDVLKFDILKEHQLPFLTEFQIDGIIKWMNDWEQLKNTAIPLRFKEDCRNSIDRTSLMIDENNILYWAYNRLILLGEDINFDYMIKIRKELIKFNQSAK